MNRGIKCRAWDYKNKRFGYFHLGEGKIIFPSQDYMDRKDGEDCSHFPNIEYWDLYIGLKDKNGKDIYGGDIYKDETGQIKVVKWDINCFTVPRMSWLVAIIGNIYKNPELLEAE